MNIFKLAEIELKREGKENAPNRIQLFFERVNTIQTYLNLCDRNKIIANKRKLKKQKLV